MITTFSTRPLTGLICAEFLSLTGNQVAAVAIPILVWQNTHSAMTTGIAVSVNYIPSVVALILGGSAIDRVGAYYISVFADIFSGLSVIALPAAYLLFPVKPALPVVILLILMGALLDPTGVAARNTMVPVLTKLAGRSLAAINTIRAGLEHAADFIGPVLGIALIRFGGVNHAFFLNAVSFIASAIIFLLAVPDIRSQRYRYATNTGPVEKKPLGTNKETPADFSAMGFIKNNSTVRSLVITGTIASLVITPFIGLLLLLVSVQRFNSELLFGFCLSAFSISSTFSALIFSKLNRSVSRTVIYYGGLMLMGIALIGCGIATTKSWIIFFSILAGTAGAGNPLEQTILQEQTPSAITGRIFAIIPAMRAIAGAIGLILAGLIMKSLPVQWVFAGAGVLLLATAIYGWITRHLE